MLESPQDNSDMSPAKASFETPATFDDHVKPLAHALGRGLLIPFLGAGANRAGRPFAPAEPELAGNDTPKQEKWSFKETRFLPDGSELAGFLANRLLRATPDSNDLLRVAQHACLIAGRQAVCSLVYEVLDRKYPTPPLQSYIGEWPALLRAKRKSPNLLVITTNYDDLMEQAFTDCGEPFDIVSYQAEGAHRGKFVHTAPGCKPVLVRYPKQYLDVSTEERSVILKLHGALDRGGKPEEGSYVISEDDYIDYLTRTDLAGLLPVNLVTLLRHSSFLFLGYRLRDWNLRVILHRLAIERQRSIKSWAVHMHPDDIDLRFWAEKDVITIPMDLMLYIERLRPILTAAMDD